MTATAEVAVIGAGPYGLSVAAHLSARGLRPLVFGRPMQSWRSAMPLGMRLKSEGFASSLSDPGRDFTLEAFCQEQKLPYADTNLPVARDIFVAYGDAFQKRLVPQLDTRLVTRVEAAPDGFTLRLEDNSILKTRQTIVATGIAPFRHVPEVLGSLSPERASHTSDHADYSRFKGQKVLVVGAGASATDVAAALLQSGARVALACRSPSLKFYAGGQARRWFEPLTAPMTPVGPGWKKLVGVKAPLLFQKLPEQMRTAIVEGALGPAPCWFIREEIEGKIEVLAGATIVGARDIASGAEVEIATQGGSHTLKVVDHVIAGTGYRVDVARLGYLDADILARLKLTKKAPRLSSNFESSVPRLYFVGMAAAYEFGPLLRFVCGADFTARRITNAVATAARLGVAAVPRLSPSANLVES